jgi:hypothetical protein
MEPCSGVASLVFEQLDQLGIRPRRKPHEPARVLRHIIQEIQGMSCTRSDTSYMPLIERVRLAFIYLDVIGVGDSLADLAELNI